MAIDTFIRSLPPDAEDVSNEAVSISNSFTSGGTTYYSGFLTYFPAPSLSDDTTSYGAWTGSAKTGSQRTVVLSGEPTETTLLLDLPAGALISTTSQTVYVYYSAWAKNIRSTGSGTGAGDLPLQVVGYCDAGSERTVHSLYLSEAAAFDSATITVLDSVSEDVFFEIGTASGESGNQEVLTLASGTTEISSTFSSTLSFASGEHIEVRVRANNGGANNPIVMLRSA